MCGYQGKRKDSGQQKQYVKRPCGAGFFYIVVLCKKMKDNVAVSDRKKGKGLGDASGEVRRARVTYFVKILTFTLRAMRGWGSVV